MKKRVLLPAVILVVLAIVFGVYKLAYPGIKSVSERSTADQAKQTTPSVKVAQRDTQIEPALQAIVNEFSNITISVSVVDLTNGHEYGAGETNTIFKGASTIKILTAAQYMHMVEQGKTTLDTGIGGQSAQAAIEAMLNRSDNPAWTAIRDYIGRENLQTYADSIGLTSFTNGDYNTINTVDYAKLLTKLYKGELTNSEHRDMILSYMQNTDNELLMPVVVPSGMTLNHKWGTIWGVLHDVGYITYNGKPYAVVIYTNNEDNTVSLNSVQVDAIHDLTKVVTDYMVRQQ